MIQTTHGLLPAELWYPIIYTLPSLDQKTCLSVSRAFHDIAATYLFSHITISLGLWRPEGSLRRREYSDHEKAAIKRHANSFYDISQHIMHVSGFAEKVKKFSVRAFAFPSPGGGEIQIAIRLLADVLRALPNLRAFAWYGIMPTIPMEILEAVLGSPKITLEDLCISLELPEASEALFTSVRGLRSLTISETARYYALDEKEYRSIRAIIAANAGTLRSLRGLSGGAWSQLPPLRNFTHLYELELWSLQTYSELGTLLEHCGTLRSLTLMHATQELIPVLHAHHHTLPNLDSFKLWGDKYTVADVAAISQFILPKRRLRSLDMMVRTCRPSWPLNDPSPTVLMPILEILRALPDLRVLGLALRATSVEGDHVQYLKAHLPENLTALLVWTDKSSAPIPAQHWIELFSAYKSLRYLHVVLNYYDQGDLHRIFVVHPPTLELFGYGAQIYPLGRDPATGAVVVHERWVYPKVYFRTVDDYGDEDWEWLLRHHAYDDDDHFMHWQEIKFR